MKENDFNSEELFTFIVIDYNSANDTIAYIKRLKEALKNNNFRVIIIDNSLNVENKSIFLRNFSYVEYFIPQIKHNWNYEGINYFEFISKIYILEESIIYVQSNSNLGFAKGNNLGALISKELYEANFMIFTNNDLFFLDKIDLFDLKKVFDNDERIGLVGPSITMPNGNNQSPLIKASIWKRIIKKNLFEFISQMTRKIYFSDVITINEPSYVYSVVGCFMVVNASIFFDIGMFDSKTFLYGEEIILSERLISQNYKIYYLPNIKVIHSHSKTISANLNYIKMRNISFESEIHYYKDYIKCRRIELMIARVIYQSNKFLFLYPKMLIKNTYFRRKECIKRSNI